MQLEGLSHVHLFSLPTHSLLSSFRLAPPMHRGDGATRGLQKEGTPGTTRLHVTTPCAFRSPYGRNSIIVSPRRFWMFVTRARAWSRGEGKLSRTILRGLGRVNRLRLPGTMMRTTLSYR